VVAYSPLGRGFLGSCRGGSPAPTISARTTSCPIPGTKRRRYLEENAGALEVELTGEDLAAIEEVTPRGSAAGARHIPQHMANA
jgi:diketogulonate reductase-like aldo/keto reductase